MESCLIKTRLADGMNSQFRCPVSHICVCITVSNLTLNVISIQFGMKPYLRIKIYPLKKKIIMTNWTRQLYGTRCSIQHFLKPPPKKNWNKTNSVNLLLLSRDGFVTNVTPYTVGLVKAPFVHKWLVLFHFLWETFAMSLFCFVSMTWKRKWI